MNAKNRKESVKLNVQHMRVMNEISIKKAVIITAFSLFFEGLYAFCQKRFIGINFRRISDGFSKVISFMINHYI